MTYKHTGRALAAMIQYGTRDHAPSASAVSIFDFGLIGMTLEELAAVCRGRAEGGGELGYRASFRGLGHVLDEFSARLLSPEVADVLAGTVTIGVPAEAGEAA